MKISQETIQEVQNRVCIEEVIGDFIPLKKSGQNLWACCPFHQEHTPSFSVSPKGFYKCFGCNASGDAITFIQEMEGHSFVEAVTYLADKYGISVVYQLRPGEQAEQDDSQTQLYEILEMAKEYYMQLLWAHPEAAEWAIPYLKERGIDHSTAGKFELGYSLNCWDGFYRFAIDKGASLALLCLSGLVVQKEDKIYDHFRFRLVFPIYNHRSQVVGFGGRYIGPRSDHVPKYINSPETAVYQKKNMLYGISLAKLSMKKMRHCYLVEGYIDLLSVHMAGFQEVVAPCGTSLTETHVIHLRRLVSKVTIIFDGDHAGIQASLRNIDMLLAHGLQVEVVPLPQDQDPASYIQKSGNEGFIAYIHEKKQDFITFKAGVLTQGRDGASAVDQAKVIHSIVESIVKIPDEIEAHLQLKQCAKMFSMDMALLENVYQKDKARSFNASFSTSSKDRFKGKKVGHQEEDTALSNQLRFKGKIDRSIEGYEREIIRMLLAYGQVNMAEGHPLYHYILIELADVSFRSSDCRMVYGYFCSMLKEGTVVDTAHCLQSTDESIKQIAIHLSASPYGLSPAWVKKYSIYTPTEENHLYQASIEVILRLKMRLIQALLEENRTHLKGVSSEQEETILLGVHQKLKASEAVIADRLGMVIVQ